MSYAADKKLKEVNMDGLYEIIDSHEGKVVVINFWSTKCGGCVKEIQEFIKLRERFNSDEVEIMGVSLDFNGLEILPEFIKKNKINYSIYVAANDYSIINEYDIRGGANYSII